MVATDDDMMRLVSSFQELRSYQRQQQNIDELPDQSVGALMGAPNLTYLSVSGLNRINAFLEGCVFLGSVTGEFAKKTNV